METRQRLGRPVRKPFEPYYRGSSSQRAGTSTSSTSEDEDRQAGRGLVSLLILVALSVVALITYRAFLSPPKVNYDLWADSDIKPVNTLREADRMNSLVEATPAIVIAPSNASLETLSEEASSEIQGEDELDEADLDEGGEEDSTRVAAAKAIAEPIPQARARRVPMLGNLLFADADEFEAAPLIIPEQPGQGKFSGMWKLLLSHEEYFAQHAHRRYIPRLAQTVSRQVFHEVFRKTSTPVIIPFEFARKLGFITEATTVCELQKRFPYDPNVEHKQVTYNKYSLTKANPDWGPAVYAISLDAKLEKVAYGVRNFPRNLHMSSRNLKALGVSRPPYIQKHRFQPASAWFGTTTSDTKFHHDCCDNFVMMIVGVKRWYIAPPTDWRKLRPVKCEGDNQSLCWASVPYPNAPANAEERRVLDSLNSITIDLKAGEMLYLPAGWWHHITNLGPTVMMNHWTFGCENVAMQLEIEPTRRDRPDFRSCERNAKEERAWRQHMDEEDGL